MQKELAPLNPAEVFYPQVLSDFYTLLKEIRIFLLLSDSLWPKTQKFQ